MKCEGLQFVVKKKLNEGKIPLQICQDQSGTVGLRTIERDGPAAAGRGADPAPCPSWEDEVRENARHAIFNKAKPERETARVYPEVGSTPGDVWAPRGSSLNCEANILVICVLLW